MTKQHSSNRGFSSMNKLKQQTIASRGRKIAYGKITAHEFDSKFLRLKSFKSKRAIQQKIR